MTMQNNIPASPGWQQVPLVWLIIAIPLSSVVVGITMLWLAISTDDGLVFDDYYQQGKEINRVLQRDAVANSHGIAAVIKLLPDSHRLKLSLSYRETLSLPRTLSLRFLHPTRSGEDIHLSLERTGTTEYLGVLPRFSTARWIVQLETNEWRVNGIAPMPGSNSITLEAQ